MDKEEMMRLIEEECLDDDNDLCDPSGCMECGEIEECYYRAVEKCNHEFAESCDYGGYDTEDEFWEQLFD